MQIFKKNGELKNKSAVISKVITAKEIAEKILGKKTGFDKTIGKNNNSQTTTKEETAIKTESLPELEENISKLEIAYKLQ